MLAVDRTTPPGSCTTPDWQLEVRRVSNQAAAAGNTRSCGQPVEWEVKDQDKITII